MFRPDLHELISKIPARGVVVALTTNASLLSQQAAKLAEAGLDRVTVSLDALDPEVHAQMTDSSTPVEAVLDGIDAALEAGLTPLKENCVVPPGDNETEVAQLVRRFLGTGGIVRSIEYMDVGRPNGRHPGQAVTDAVLLATRQGELDLTPLGP